jgi:hypothetical protein
MGMGCKHAIVAFPARGHGRWSAAGIGFLERLEQDDADEIGRLHSVFVAGDELIEEGAYCFAQLSSVKSPGAKAFAA